MASYLERYRRGECEQVWAELLVLGKQVREPRLYDEAVAVARETMTRARNNIEMLVPRLTSLGYRFAYPDRVFVPADEEFRRLVTDVERRVGPLPLSLRAWCEVVGEVNFMGSHPKLSTYFPTHDVRQQVQGFLTLLGQYGGPAVAAGDPLRQGVAVTQGLLQQLVQSIRTGQPRSPEVAAGVRASREFLEAMQRPAACPEPEVDSDPLVVEPYFGDLEDDPEEGDEDAGQAELVKIRHLRP